MGNRAHHTGHPQFVTLIRTERQFDLRQVLLENISKMPDTAP